jgi:hypothetical protein
VSGSIRDPSAISSIYESPIMYVQFMRLLMNNFSYDDYKKEALAAKGHPKMSLNAAKKPSRKSGGGSSAKKGTKGSSAVSGTPYPNVSTKFDYRRINIALLEETARSPPVARSLWQLQLVAFPWCDFTVVPPKGSELDPKDTEQLEPKIEEIDRRINTAILSAQAMYDIMTYGSAIFEVTWKEDDDGWVVPDVVQRLPASSFRISPSGVTKSTDRYVVGNLLKGIVFDKEEQKMQYWQVQNSSGLSVTPVQIPTENIIHIKDSRSQYVDGEPYLAGITSSIAQLEFIRKRMMQTINRVGAPPVKITVGVPKEYMTEGIQNISSALPGASSTDGDDYFTQLWGYANALAENVTTDAATVIPNGINYDYQRPSIPINPTEPDQYIIREIISHIFPRDILDVLGSAISTSSAPLLDLLKLMVQGWQAICSMPFEQDIWTAFVNKNGFDKYRIELEWAPLVTPDKSKEDSLTLQKLNLHVITVKEARTELGYDTTDEDFNEIVKELGIWKSGPQQPGMGGGSPFGGGEGEPGASDMTQLPEAPGGEPTTEDYSALFNEGNSLLQKYQEKFRGLI